MRKWVREQHANNTSGSHGYAETLPANHLKNPFHYARCDITALGSPLIPTHPPLPSLSSSFNECATNEHYARISRTYGSRAKQRPDGPVRYFSSRLGECTHAEVQTTNDPDWKIQTNSDSETYVDDADDHRSSSPRSTLSGARSIINSDDSDNLNSVSLWPSSTLHASELIVLPLAYISSMRHFSFCL